MLKFGEPPYLECSSRGVKVFSAFYARPKSLNGKSIEEAYQAMKVFEDGSTGKSWKYAKGKQAVNVVACAVAYTKWWNEWVDEQGLLPRLKEATGLSDMFGQKGHLCQAEVLWNIRNVKEVDAPKA